MKIKIAELRKQQRPKVSQAQLAEMAKISRSYLCDLESGKFNNPGIIILCKLAHALGCKVDDLVDCEGGD